MSHDDLIADVDLTRGESVSAGYYTGLQQVLNGYLSSLESLFFDRFNLTFQFSYRLKQPLKFNQYLDTINQPCPIFVFRLSAFEGPSLLILDNPLANLILQQKALRHTGQVQLRRDFQVSLENYPLLEETTDQALGSFAAEWDRLVDCEHTLHKLVSHKIKAKIMSPMETCLVAQIKVAYKSFSTHFELCFSAYQLDQVLRLHGYKGLLLGDSKPLEHQRLALDKLLKTELTYQASATIGSLNLSKEQLETALKTGHVLKIDNELQTQVCVSINGLPLFSADVGQSLGNQAVQIKGSIQEIRQQQRDRPRPFEPTQFPSV